MPLSINAPDLRESTPERIVEWLGELEDLRDDMWDDPQALEVIDNLSALADEELRAAIARLKASSAGA
jgi:hypothetical protein